MSPRRAWTWRCGPLLEVVSKAGRWRHDDRPHHAPHLASFFAKNEFQAIQFIPLVILPQIFLSDIIWDIQTFPRAFQLLSYALPLTHANIAVREMFVRGGDLTNVGPQVAVLGGFLVICIALIEGVGRRQLSA